MATGSGGQSHYTGTGMAIYMAIYWAQGQREEGQHGQSRPCCLLFLFVERFIECVLPACIYLLIAGEGLGFGFGFSFKIRSLSQEVLLLLVLLLFFYEFPTQLSPAKSCHCHARSLCSPFPIPKPTTNPINNKAPPLMTCHAL